MLALFDVRDKLNGLPSHIFFILHFSFSVLHFLFLLPSADSAPLRGNDFQSRRTVTDYTNGVTPGIAILGTLTTVSQPLVISGIKSSLEFIAMSQVISCPV